MGYSLSGRLGYGIPAPTDEYGEFAPPGVDPDAERNEDEDEDEDEDDFDRWYIAALRKLAPDPTAYEWRMEEAVGIKSALAGVDGYMTNAIVIPESCRESESGGHPLSFDALPEVKPEWTETLRRFAEAAGLTGDAAKPRWMLWALWF